MREAARMAAAERSVRLRQSSNRSAAADDAAELAPARLGGEVGATDAVGGESGAGGRPCGGRLADPRILLLSDVLCVHAFHKMNARRYI